MTIIAVLGAFGMIMTIYSVWLVIKGDQTPDYVGWFLAALYKSFETLMVLAVFAFVALVVLKIVAP